MAATEFLCQLAGINPDNLTKEEALIFEVELFDRVCGSLKDLFSNEYKSYFNLLKSTDLENSIMEEKYVQCVLNDILLTQEYTLEGIALYTQTPEDVVYEIVTGLNTRPTASFLRKTIELHRSIRPELYREIIKKIAVEYLAAG